MGEMRVDRVNQAAVGYGQRDRQAANRDGKRKRQIQEQRVISGVNIWS